jgi:cytochrome c-type biogenesis protein
MHDVSLWLAFGAGVVSFLSPCTLPLFPSYLGYITGVSFRSLQEGAAGQESLRLRAFLHALCFCLGLSFLFILLGWGATAVGSLLADYRDLVRLVGGVLIVVMGLFMAGVIKSEWLMRERRYLPATKPVGYIGSFVVGVAFAAGWSPCVGPVLGSVLYLVATNPSVGTTYMVAYALGFSLPFLALALTLSSVRPLLKYTGIISRIGGWLLVLMGVLLVTDKMAWIAAWLQKVTGYTGV